MKKKKNFKLHKVYLALAMVFIFSFTGCGTNEEEFLSRANEETVEDPTPSPQPAPENNESPEAAASADQILPTETPIPTPAPVAIYVDVSGAVQNPGVYCMMSDSRVFQAVEAAGGYLPEAAVDYINGAQSVYDGQQIYVPYNTETQGVNLYESSNGTGIIGSSQTNAGQEAANPSAQIASAGPTDASSSGLVNINTADLQTLMTLNGIGEAKAAAIIAYRETNGAFSSIEDIMNVSGIKDGTFQKLKDQITV